MNTNDPKNPNPHEGSNMPDAGASHKAGASPFSEKFKSSPSSDKVEGSSSSDKVEGSSSSDKVESSSSSDKVESSPSSDKGKGSSNPLAGALKQIEGMGLNNLLEGRNLVLVGAGMYGLMLILQVLACFYYLGLMPWLLLSLIVQLALVVPFFTATKSKNLFPYSVAVSVIIYVLFSGQHTGITNLVSYLEPDESGALELNPRITELNLDAEGLTDQLEQREEAFRLLDKAASERGKGNENSAKDAEAKLEKLDEKLSTEKKKELNGNLIYINNQIKYRKWKDANDAFKADWLSELDVLIMIGILLATSGAWVLRKEQGT